MWPGSSHQCARLLFFCLCVAPGSRAQTPAAALRGRVTLEGRDAPLHHVTVTITQLRRVTETDDRGEYRFTEVPPGNYDVLAHLHATINQKRSVVLAPGQEAALDFQLRLGVVHEQVTVTASGTEQTPLETFQAVTAVDSLELATRNAPSLGEVLDDQPGVAKRSFGPGTTRPVLRGFDGDRVLILQDGVPTGTISSQSGDHGEPLDSSAVDRVEVVKGPTTMLYGGSALGGVINIITGHQQPRQQPHQRTSGYITGNAASGNALASGGAGFEHGVGSWLIWGDGGEQRTGDYQTPAGRVENSHTRMSNAFGGFGRYGERALFSLSYGFQEGRYGVPSGTHAEGVAEKTGGQAEACPTWVCKSLVRHCGTCFSLSSSSWGKAFSATAEGEHNDEAGLVDLAFRRHNLRFNTGRGNLGSRLDRFDLALNYSDWMHKELEDDVVGTQLFNKQFVYRGTFEQRPAGGLSGRFGFSGLERSFSASGEERLAPPVRQRGAALFGLEELGIERVRLRFGGRVEYAGYSPQELRRRSFIGLSAAAGAHLPLWRDGALALNYTHSFRPPALEELYNHGPHTGNLTFEIGNPALEPEQGQGVDLSLRQRSARIHGEANFFYYALSHFVYLAPTGQIRHGLIEAQYRQAGSRYLGAEAHVDFHLRPTLVLDTSLDAVDAQLRDSRTPLPRIPPARGRISLDYAHKNLRLKPELVLTNAQSHLFPTETRTAGYALLNLDASYNWASQHTLQVISVNLTNAANRLYRNHLSFIKDWAPEMGRSVRLTYTVRFF